ncbi:MAG: hypothetical protein AB9869_11455 [Verrucomicrobiia bacterium]
MTTSKSPSSGTSLPQAVSASDCSIPPKMAAAWNKDIATLLRNEELVAAVLAPDCNAWFRRIPQHFRIFS